MNRLNHWLYQKEKPLNITEEWRFDFNFDYDPPCLGLVVVLNESRMVELLETERKYAYLKNLPAWCLIDLAGRRCLDGHSLDEAIGDYEGEEW